MKQRIIALMCVSLLLMGLMVFSGCSDDDDDPDLLNIIGTWLAVAGGYDIISPITISITAHTAAGAGGVVATATPSGGDPAYIAGITVATDGAPGVENPRGITIVITFSDGGVLTMTGTVSDNNNSMSGRYSNSQGFSDDWSANRQQ